VKVSLHQLLEESVGIAWDYLRRTDEIGADSYAANFLADSVDAMIRGGQRNRMFLANMAIIKYRAARDNVVTLR
jgi:hypothetical protein